jgi:hypothetical protein
MMRRTILSAVLFAATVAAGGCFTSAEVGYSSGPGYASGGGEAYVSTPDLVEVSPGVQVVADYDEPVFYTDGFYWRFYNNGWYRSNNYSTGWYFYERPPVAVLRIERPYAYAHYRPQGYVVRNRARYRPIEPVVRDHRQAEPVGRHPPGGSHREQEVVVGRVGIASFGGVVPVLVIRRRALSAVLDEVIELRHSGQHPFGQAPAGGFKQPCARFPFGHAHDRQAGQHLKTH